VGSQSAGQAIWPEDDEQGEEGFDLEQENIEMGEMGDEEGDREAYVTKPSLRVP